MSREQNKRNAIVGGATAAGMGAGAAAGYRIAKPIGDKKAGTYVADSVSRYNSHVRRINGQIPEGLDTLRAKSISPAQLMAHKDVKDQMKTIARTPKRTGMIAGAAIGGTLALEGARHFTKKKEVKKNSRLSAFGVEHISKRSAEYEKNKKYGDISRNIAIGAAGAGTASFGVDAARLISANKEVFRAAKAGEDTSAIPRVRPKYLSKPVRSVALPVGIGALVANRAHRKKQREIADKSL